MYVNKEKREGKREKQKSTKEVGTPYLASDMGITFLHSLLSQATSSVIIHGLQSTENNPCKQIQPQGMPIIVQPCYLNLICILILINQLEMFFKLKVADNLDQSQLIPNKPINFLGFILTHIFNLYLITVSMVYLKGVSQNLQNQRKKRNREE